MAIAPPLTFFQILENLKKNKRAEKWRETIIDLKDNFVRYKVKQYILMAQKRLKDIFWSASRTSSWKL